MKEAETNFTTSLRSGRLDNLFVFPRLNYSSHGRKRIARGANKPLPSPTGMIIKLMCNWSAAATTLPIAVYLEINRLIIASQEQAGLYKGAR